jgi:hypothetical protein
MPGLFSGEKGEKVCELFFFASKHFCVSRMLCFADKEWVVGKHG